MGSISNLIDKVLTKYTDVKLKELKSKLSANLEFRLLFNINLDQPFKIARKQFVKHYLSDLLVMNLGNISRVSEVAGINRRHIHRLLSDLDIKVDDYRRTMIKRSNYMEQNVQNIVEETVKDVNPVDSSSIYTNIHDISKILATSLSNPVDYDEAIALFEKEYIVHALKENSNNLKKTAKAIEVSERTLYRKIKELEIEL